MYEQVSHDIAVRAEPAFQDGESDPDQSRFVWHYTIEIENRGRESVQVLARHWRISDANGVTLNVRGEGVVGVQPVIEPGETFRYTSMCPLSAPSGMMLGAYDVLGADTGVTFSVAIPAFPLDSPFASKLAN